MYVNLQKAIFNVQSNPTGREYSRNYRTDLYLFSY